MVRRIQCANRRTLVDEKGQMYKIGWIKIDEHWMKWGWTSNRTRTNVR
jgi:hypothetical protein